MLQRHDDFLKCAGLKLLWLRRRMSQSCSAGEAETLAGWNVTQLGDAEIEPRSSTNFAKPY